MQADRLEVLGSTPPHVSRTPQHLEVLLGWQDIYLLAASPDDQYGPHGTPGGLSNETYSDFLFMFPPNLHCQLEIINTVMQSVISASIEMTDAPS